MTNKPQQEQSAMAIVFAENKILYTEEVIYGKVVNSLPKGHVELGETVVETARRECCEETGVDLSQATFVLQIEGYSYEFVNSQGNRVIKQICPVVFLLPSEQPTKTTELRVNVAKFVQVAYFLSICSYDSVRQIVERALLATKQRKQ